MALPGGFGGQFGLIQQGSTNDSSSSTSATDTQLQTDLTKLQTDQQAIQDKSQVTPAELAAVRTDLQALQKDVTSKPDATAVTTLDDDIKALNGQLPSATQTAQLTTDFTAVLTSEGVTDQTLITQTISDIQAVATSSNVTADDLTTIAADQAAIQADQLGNAPIGSTITADGTQLLGALSGGQTGGAGVGAIGGLDGGIAIGQAIPVGFGGMLHSGFIGMGQPATTTSTSSSTGSSTSPTTSTTPSQLQTDLTKLQTDQQAIQDKSQVTPAELAAVRTDLQALQKAATKTPDATAETTFANDIKALNGLLPAATQSAQLTTDFTALLTTEGITDQTLISQAISDIQAVATSSNVTADDLTTLAADQAAIKADSLSNSPAGSTGTVDDTQLLNALTGGQAGGSSISIRAASGGPMGGMSDGGPMGGMSDGGPMGGRFGGRGRG
jgi:hypothetical protein